MKRLLYVVHRYAPYPGGSEYNVQRYAEASVRLGHDVTVVANTHKGDYRGVKVTNDIGWCLQQTWDAIIVHGHCQYQNVIHSSKQKSPVLYLLIRADEVPVCIRGAEYADWIGCATQEDINFATRHGEDHKIIPIEYAYECLDAEYIDPEHLDIQLDKQYTFLSCGGYAPHKGFDQLVQAFCELERDDVQLILTGYDLSREVTDYIEIGKQNGKSIQMFHLENPAYVSSLMYLSDLYIWNSEIGSEGYGLVLLESMAHSCEWIGTDQAGATRLKKRGYGETYRSYDQLKHLMETFEPNEDKTANAVEYVIKNHDPLTVTKNMLKRIGM